MTILDNISEQDYRAMPGLSGTEVATLLDNPADMHWQRQHATTSTAAQTFGTIVHALVLGQPLPCVVSEYPDFKTKAAQEWKVAQEASGLIVVKGDELDRAFEIAKAVRDNADAAALLDVPGESEVSVTGEHRGHALKGRIDRLPDDGPVLDLKTAKDSSPRAMSRFIGDYGTATQLAHYALLTGREHHRPIIIAVRNTGRPAVAVYRLAEVTWHVAVEATKRAWDIYADCMDTGIWPDPHAAQINELELRSWDMDALDPVEEMEIS